MADDLRMALTNLVRKVEMAGDVDFLRDGVRILGQTLMDLEVSQHLRAEENERTPERAGHRNGYRARQWDTRVGVVELQVPRVQDGSFFPSLLEPGRRAERATGWRCPGSVRPRRFHRASGRARESAWDDRDQQEPGFAPLRGARCGGRAFPDAPPVRGVSVSLVVISDSHQGLKDATAATLGGAC